jgi:DNA-binding response OmpR family regulator
MDSKHIFYLEDDTDLAEVVLTGLKFSGFSAEWFSSGTSAREALRRKTPAFDAMLLDHNVGGLTGLEIASEARLLGFAGPILLLSGDTNSGARPEEERAITARLNKPLSLSELITCLNRHLHPDVG